jgi:hypothetical protein
MMTYTSNSSYLSESGLRQSASNLSRILFIKVNFDFDQVLVRHLIEVEVRLDATLIHPEIGETLTCPTELAESAYTTELYLASSFKPNNTVYQPLV